MPDFDWMQIVGAGVQGALGGLFFVTLYGIYCLVRLLVNFIVDWTAALVFNRGPKAQLTDRTGHTD